MSDERLRKLEREAIASGPGTDATLRLYSELRRTGLDHLAVMDRLWFAFRSPDALLALDEVAFAIELAGEPRPNAGELVDTIVWPVDAVQLVRLIGLSDEDFAWYVSDRAEDQIHPADQGEVQAARALAGQINDAGLGAQLGYLLREYGQTWVRETIREVVDNYPREYRKHLDMALDRRLGDSNPRLYVRDGWVNESSWDGTSAALVEFTDHGLASFVAFRTELSERRRRGPNPIVRRGSTLSHDKHGSLSSVPGVNELCRAAFDAARKTESFWAMRRALDNTRGMRRTGRQSRWVLEHPIEHEPEWNLIAPESSLSMGSLLDT